MFSSAPAPLSYLWFCAAFQAPQPPCESPLTKAGRHALHFSPLIWSRSASCEVPDRWPAPLLDDHEKLLHYLAAARQRGVKFDVGHGAGSFHFRNAEPAVRQGFWPDSISTDLHAGSINGALIDMLNVMSKFLAMGVPLKEVIRESTTNPATQIKRPQLGQIAAGAEADVAVLRLEKGRFGFVDVKGGRIEGVQRLGCEMTVRAGKIVFDSNGRAGTPWREAKIDYPTR